MAVAPFSSYERVNIGHGTLIAVWVTFGVASLVFWTRIVVQLNLGKRPGIDDYLMLAAWILHTVCCALNTASIHWGLGHHYYDLSLSSLTSVVKYHWLALPFAVFSPMLGRISFAAFLLSVLALVSRRRRQFLFTLITLQILINVSLIILAFCQCRPVEKLWGWTITGKCWPTSITRNFAYAQGAFNSFTDLSLTVLAAALIYRLKVKPLEKLTLMITMSLSILATVGSVMKTIYVEGLGKQDQPYTLRFLVIWYTVENNTVIITSSIPKIKPLLDKCLRSFNL